MDHLSEGGKIPRVSREMVAVPSASAMPIIMLSRSTPPSLQKVGGSCLSSGRLVAHGERSKKDLFTQGEAACLPEYRL